MQGEKNQKYLHYKNITGLLWPFWERGPVSCWSVLMPLLLLLLLLCLSEALHFFCWNSWISQGGKYVFQYEGEGEWTFIHLSFYRTEWKWTNFRLCWVTALSAQKACGKCSYHWYKNKSLHRRLALMWEIKSFLGSDSRGGNSVKSEHKAEIMAGSTALY